MTIPKDVHFSGETEKTGELVTFAQLATIDRVSLAATIVAVSEANVAACARGAITKPYIIIAKDLYCAYGAFSSGGQEYPAYSDEKPEYEYAALAASWWKHAEDGTVTTTGGVTEHHYSTRVAVRRTDGENYTEAAFTDFSESYDRHAETLMALRNKYPGEYDDWLETYDWEGPVAHYIHQHTAGAFQADVLEARQLLKQAQPIPPELGATLVARCIVLELCPLPTSPPTDEF